MGLRWRITLPFLALISLVWGATIFLAVRIVERAVERRFQAQADGLARLMSSRGFPINDASVRYIDEAYGARIVVTRGEKTIASSGTPPEKTVVVRAPLVLEGGAGELALHYPAEIVERERTSAVRPVLVLGMITVALAAALGLLLAHTIARPIERLASQAGVITPEGVRRVGGGREIDTLVEALNRMAAEIRRAEQFAVMGKMAASVAHEIRNPIAAMKLNVQMLREGAQDREPYDMLLREIERLELAAGELAGRPDRGEKESTSLPRVVDEVLELLHPQLTHLGISVKKTYEDCRPVALEVARFKRAVMNLVLNGAQAMPQGGSLAIAVQSTGNGAVRLSVADEGSGISPDVRDRLFEPFVTTKQDGVGLGLVLTKRIVEEHGGAISLETGRTGTVFFVELPAHGENSGR